METRTSASSTASSYGTVTRGELDEASLPYRTPHEAAASPEHLPDSQVVSSSLPSDYPASPSSHVARMRLRPAFGRSVSTSTVATDRRSGTLGRINDLSSSFFRLSRQERPPDREWTVFGQMMENDDPLGSRRTPSSSYTRPSIRDGFPFPGCSSVRSGTGLPKSTSEVPESLLEEPEMESPHSGSFLNTQPMTEEPQQEAHVSSDEETVGPASDSTVSPEDPPPTKRAWYSPSRIPPIPVLYLNILKCSIAYFIGSLFTFSPYLSSFIADMTNYGPGEAFPSPSGHMVATVAVYFNPAKTLGAMVEADTFCLMGVLFAAFVSLSSMSMFWFFETQPGWEWLADFLVLLWIGLGMSAIAWMKQWMNKPSFNTACSMTSIMLFVVVVREGGLETLLQVSFIVLVGAILSNLICVLLWPQSATNGLRSTMTKTLKSFVTLLDLVTETFLLEETMRDLTQEKLKRAVDDHQSSFTSLKKNLVEAQSEWMFGGPGKASGLQGYEARRSSGQAYEDAIASLNRLGQHLNGLRSGMSLQYDLIKAHRNGNLTIKSLKRRETVLERDVNGKSRISEASSRLGREAEETAMLQAAADMFGELMEDLGPPLKALSTICVSSLNQLEQAFNRPRSGGLEEIIDSVDVQKLADEIERALYTFESTSNHAVLRLYRNHNVSGTQSPVSLHSASDENQVITGNDGEHVFLVYFFIFTLQEFAKELISLVDAMGRICTIESARAARGSTFSRVKGVFTWIFGRRGRRTAREKRGPASLRKRISAYFVPERHRSVSFPKIKPHAPNTMLTPARSDLSFPDQIKQWIWSIGSRLREQDLKYAFKVGMATAMLAAPAFFDSTRPMFVKYRGEWALISFFVVISPTIGATNFLGVHRILGTLCGAVVAVSIWTLAPENPYVLSIFGFFFSIPCFYYIVAKPVYATSARFVLLTYNLTCLYCYNLRQKDIDVKDVAFHRACAVAVGVIWAAIVSRYWWPTEARRALSRALGDFCLNMGWLYTRLAAFNSFSDSEVEALFGQHEDVDESTSLLHDSDPALTNSIHDFMAMELHLQVKLIELQGLLAQTQHEPRLKGPFPVAIYRNILTSLQAILDRLHSMRCVTARREWHTTVRRDFILPVNRERREMVGNMILYFSVLASVFSMKTPLPPYLPPAEQARQRLVDAIRRLDVVRNRDVKGSRQLLFFAYALTMKGVIQELDRLGYILQEAFGVIGGSTEAFESLFMDNARTIV